MQNLKNINNTATSNNYSEIKITQVKKGHRPKLDSMDIKGAYEVNDDKILSERFKNANANVVIENKEPAPHVDKQCVTSQSSTKNKPVVPKIKNFEKISSINDTGIINQPGQKEDIGLDVFDYDEVDEKISPERLENIKHSAKASFSVSGTVTVTNEDKTSAKNKTKNDLDGSNRLIDLGQNSHKSKENQVNSYEKREFPETTQIQEKALIPEPISNSNERSNAEHITDSNVFNESNQDNITQFLPVENNIELQNNIIINEQLTQPIRKTDVNDKLNDREHNEHDHIEHENKAHLENEHKPLSQVNVSHRELLPEQEIKLEVSQPEVNINSNNDNRCAINTVELKKQEDIKDIEDIQTEVKIPKTVEYKQPEPNVIITSDLYKINKVDIKEANLKSLSLEKENKQTEVDNLEVINLEAKVETKIETIENVTVDVKVQVNLKEIELEKEQENVEVTEPIKVEEKLIKETESVKELELLNEIELIKEEELIKDTELIKEEELIKETEIVNEIEEVKEVKKDDIKFDVKIISPDFKSYNSSSSITLEVNYDKVNFNSANNIELFIELKMNEDNNKAIANSESNTISVLKQEVEIVESPRREYEVKLKYKNGIIETIIQEKGFQNDTNDLSFSADVINSIEVVQKEKGESSRQEEVQELTIQEEKNIRSLIIPLIDSLFKKYNGNEEREKEIIHENQEEKNIRSLITPLIDSLFKKYNGNDEREKEITYESLEQNNIKNSITSYIESLFKKYNVIDKKERELNLETQEEKNIRSLITSLVDSEFKKNNELIEKDYLQSNKLNEEIKLNKVQLKSHTPSNTQSDTQSNTQSNTQNDTHNPFKHPNESTNKPNTESKVKFSDLLGVIINNKEQTKLLVESSNETTNINPIGHTGHIGTIDEKAKGRKSEIINLDLKQNFKDKLAKLKQKPILEKIHTITEEPSNTLEDVQTLNHTHTVNEKPSKIKELIMRVERHMLRKLKFLYNLI